MIDPHTAKILGGSPCVMFQIGLDMFQDLEFHQIPKSPKSDPFLVANPVVLVTKCPRFRQLSIHCLLYVLQASQPARPPTRHEAVRQVAYPLENQQFAMENQHF